MSAAGAPLGGRGALVTGVSRRAGIGYAVARRLREAGADVVIQGFDPGPGSDTLAADAGGVAALAADLRVAAHVEEDFADPAAPAACVAAAAAAVGHVDILIANHAASCDQDLEQLDAAAIDATLAVNVRATLLLVQAYAARHDDARPGGRVVLLTSGQDLEPMPRELPYAASKGALHTLTASLAAHLAPRGILVNALNPGPTDTGWATPELTRHELRRLPLGRWGTAEDAARAIAWLAGDEAAWVCGQVITSDGGFSLSRG
ncbi:MAG TPA: SDR family oxidoreductase [Solirubrobacteraceae bacterium]|nr:SDR family oxidoreductase [Solirubrobacteraceae bacterium]